MAAASAPKSRSKTLPERLAAGTRLAGLDLGTKTIGIALSDPGLQIATPLHTIRRTKFAKDAEALLALCAREKVGGLVLGLPINMNGTEGPRAQATRAFLRNLAPLTDDPGRALGRAALDRRRRARHDRGRPVAQEARRKDRRRRGGFHPAGRARPAGARFGATAVAPSRSSEIADIEIAATPSGIADIDPASASSPDRPAPCIRRMLAAAAIGRQPVARACCRAARRRRRPSPSVPRRRGSRRPAARRSPRLVGRPPMRRGRRSACLRAEQAAEQPAAGLPALQPLSSSSIRACASFSAFSCMMIVCAM